MNNKKETLSYIKGVLMGVIVTVTCFVVLVTVGLYTGRLDLNSAIKTGSSQVTDEQAEKIKDKVNLLSAYIDKYYLNNIDYEKMADSIYKGILNGLDDKYAAYYTKDEYKDISEKSSGVFCGIGAYMSQNSKTGVLTIIGVVSGGPAEKAGVKKGDILVEVDGENIENKDISYIVSKVKGKEGTSVEIALQRKNAAQLLKMKIERKVIRDNTVSHKMLDNNIGYISVSGFEEATEKQFIKAVDDLENKGEKGLIIDIRDNGGGLLNTAIGMLDRLLPKELVVYTKDKQGMAQEYYTKDKQEVNVPIVILVNGNSASASEVFSGALKDYGKAKLIGTKTFGKGIVQSSFELQDKTAIKFTTSKYYTPKGNNIHGKGFEPDMKVEYTGKMTKLKETGIKVDNQVEAALDYFENVFR